MPAEWEAQEAVWLQWPAERMRKYAGYGVKLESTWLEMTRLLHTEVRVRIILGSDPERDRLRAQFHQFGIDSSRCDLFVIGTDDVWARDNGPIFVLDAHGGMTVTDWNFNGWGGRFAWHRLPYRHRGPIHAPGCRFSTGTHGGQCFPDSQRLITRQSRRCVPGNPSAR